FPVARVVYARRSFGGPEAVLAYLSRYTHLVAISNSRLISLNKNGVTFKWKDYPSKGRDKTQLMTLPPDEFIRRFLLHVLPSGFRIRRYGLFANLARVKNIERARELLAAERPVSDHRQRQKRQSRWTSHAELSLPMLRWTNDYHRDLRARSNVAIQTTT